MHAEENVRVSAREGSDKFEGAREEERDMRESSVDIVEARGVEEVASGVRWS